MTGPPPPSPPPAGTPLLGSPRWTTGSVVLLLLAGACWVGFVLVLVMALFVWIAASGSQGTGWAWPITGAAVVLFVLAIWLSRQVDRRHTRRRVHG